VIIRRLSQLYGVNTRPLFFPANGAPTNVKNLHVPHCISELPVLPVAEYKSLFITQEFQENGKYIVAINVNGRFELIAVDDRIPIY
jgi:hypothetical protein